MKPTSPAADDAFRDFVDASSAQLLRLAWLICGDEHLAEELVQESLERAYLRWSKIADCPLAYVRRTVINLNTDRWRRRHRELLSVTGEPPDQVVADRTSAVDQRLVLTRALQSLPARERQIVVLRHYADLPEREVADLLGVSVGTVKSSASRGLASLRRSLSPNATDQEASR